MNLDWRAVALLVVVAAGGGYLAGFSNKKVETKVEEKIVEKVVTVEVEKQSKEKESTKIEKQNDIEIVTTNKDGSTTVIKDRSKETIDINKEVEKRVQERLAQSEKDKSTTKSTVSKPASLNHTSIQLGLKKDGLGLDSLREHFVYGIQVDRNVFSAITVGAWVLAEEKKGIKDFGISVGVNW